MERIASFFDEQIGSAQSAFVGVAIATRKKEAELLASVSAPQPPRRRVYHCAVRPVPRACPW
eukprot:7188068-Prymnesium_polylepis.2